MAPRTLMFLGLMCLMVFSFLHRPRLHNLTLAQIYTLARAGGMRFTLGAYVLAVLGIALCLWGIWHSLSE